MKLRGLALAAAVLGLLACNGKTVNLGGGSSPAGQTEQTTSTAHGDAWSFANPDVPVMTSATKVDILLAVDNSPGMGGKSEMLAQSLHGYIDRIAARTPDIHLGIVTSSLGNMGPDVNGACAIDPAHPDNDTHAHLQRNDATGNVVAANGVLAMTQPSDLAAFEDGAAKLVRGVGEKGCGFEAQLESMYRFLIQPDPWDQVGLDGFSQADLGDGVDAQVLADRKAFLRPDSLLVVLMLTDEDDSTADPLAVGGFGWAFRSRVFPGSEVRRDNDPEGTTAPRGTSTCDTNPGDPACTSCGFAADCDPMLPSCKALLTDPNCTASEVPGSTGVGINGYFGPSDDDLNVRFARMKQRFGVDPQYPIDRYLAGFNSSSVPNRAAEHAVTTAANGQRQIADYTHRNTCTNPLYASSLPSGTGDELCNLPRGPRTPVFVMFGLITGVPTDLGDTANPSWPAINGADPTNFNYTGIDPRMIASTTPRTGVASDWDTQQKDLEYACTFTRATPLDCTAVGEIECECGPSATHAPLCSSTTPTQEVLDKAYPSTRELRFAQNVGSIDRVTIGSICAPSTDAYATFLARFAAATTAKVIP